MFNSDTELFFPIRVIPSLKDVRGKEWEDLIQKISSPDATELEQIAFTNLIVRLAGCAGCDADSFRAMRGCTQCSRLVIKRFKSTDGELLEQYAQCKDEVAEFLKKR
jgi:hypothetical protein